MVDTFCNSSHSFDCHIGTLGVAPSLAFPLRHASGVFRTVNGCSRQQDSAQSAGIHLLATIPIYIIYEATYYRYNIIVLQIAAKDVVKSQAVSVL